MTRCPPSPAACSFTTTAQNRKLEEPGAWTHMVCPLPADPSQDLVSSPGIPNLPTCTCAHTHMLSFTHKPLYPLKAIIPRVHTLAHTRTQSYTHTHTQVNVNRPPHSPLHIHKAFTEQPQTPLTSTHTYTLPCPPHTAMGPVYTPQTWSWSPAGAHGAPAPPPRLPGSLYRRRGWNSAWTEIGSKDNGK